MSAKWCMLLSNGVSNSTISLNRRCSRPFTQQRFSSIAASFCLSNTIRVFRRLTTWCYTSYRVCVKSIWWLYLTRFTSWWKAGGDVCSSVNAWAGWDLATVTLALELLTEFLLLLESWEVGFTLLVVLFELLWQHFVFHSELSDLFWHFLNRQIVFTSGKAKLFLPSFNVLLFCFSCIKFLLQDSDFVINGDHTLLLFKS